MRSEFEKNRYWIGLYRSDVDFDESLGEFGRYVANGSRRFDAANLESFNEKWEAYANAYQHQQSKVDELQKRVDAALKLLAQLNSLDDEACNRWKREACLFSQGESNAYEHATRLLERALKGESNESST